MKEQIDESLKRNLPKKSKFLKSHRNQWKIRITRKKNEK